MEITYTDTQIRLVEDDQRTKAACWAYFAEDVELAIKILLTSAGE